MDIYVLIETATIIGRECNDIVGVFTSRSNAEQAQAVWENQNPDNEYIISHWNEELIDKIMC